MEIYDAATSFCNALFFDNGLLDSPLDPNEFPEGSQKRLLGMKYGDFFYRIEVTRIPVNLPDKVDPTTLEKTT